jgi:PASTA domain
MAARLVRFQEGMKLGHGYDLLNGVSLASPAVQGAISTIQDAGGQTVTKSFLRIDDQKTLHETIGVNVDAGGSYFGIGGDIKVQYARECNLSQFATHVMVHVSVEDAFESFDDPVLTSDAIDLLKNVGKPESERFKQRFGDVFIDGLRRGGEYFATWEIVSTDQSVREKIATHVEAGFDDILASAHLDVDVQNASASTSAHVEVHVHVFQAGSIDHTDQTMAEIMQKAHDFPPTVAGNLAVPFAVSLANYNTLKLPNDQFDFIQIQNQQDVLAEHAQKRFEFLTQRNSISYARQHPEQFVGADDAKLAKELSDITDAINKMETEASACLRDASKCEFTKFDISDFPLPQLLSPSQHPSSITVPDVLEEDASVAQATLEALGLRCTVTIQAVPGLLPHFVGSQDPPAGSTVPAGTTVNLVVAP